MSRPLRLEFVGALYHVTSRGDRQQVIYCDDTDRLVWLEILARVCSRFNFTIHGFCQMTNHYHMLVETADANLSSGMRQLNANYSQYFNRRHGLVGHLFQGRYKAILVQKESHLREVARYVVLNPVRAGMVASPADWRWSSYYLMVQPELTPDWLDSEWILAQFADNRQDAIQAYQRFVEAGVGASNPVKNARHQLLLGDDEFVAKYHSVIGSLVEVTRVQRRALALSLAEYQANYADRDVAMTQAYWSTAYTMAQIAEHFGVSYRTVSRVIQRSEQPLRQSSCAIGRTDPGCDPG